MIRAVVLGNFKCFAEQRIPLGALTLLTGQNGMGKSSVMQSLLLLRQSAREGLLPNKGLLLNGELVRLGTAQDVLHESAQTEEVRLALEFEGRTTGWAFSASHRRDDVLPIAGVAPAPPDEPLFDRRCHYLAAERIGPREVYESSDYQVEQRGEMQPDGAYAVAFLDARASQTVEPALVKDPDVGPTLLAQVTAWLGEVSPGVRLTTALHPEVNRATLSVSFTAGRAVSRRLRPTAVGFGLSYLLPVLVALLASKPGGLVLLENPEAHLHPRGQMAMGELLARAASAGVQVVVETHSDHVLNGVRLAVKQGTLAASSAAFHYFSRHEEGDRIVHRVTSPRIDVEGRIDAWPEGFFDQWELALEKLL